MKKTLKIALIFVILLFCAVSVANAATNEELLAYVGKNFTVAGKSVSLSAENKLKVERYLKAYPVSSEDADKIIAKIDEGVKLMNDAGTAEVTKLTQAQKDKLLSLAEEAASIAGATISYDAKDGAVSIYKDGVLFDKASVGQEKGLVQTGTDYSFVVYTIAGVAIIAVAAVAITRKNKVNV